MAICCKNVVLPEPGLPRSISLSRWRLPLMLGIVSRNWPHKPVKLFLMKAWMLETSIQFWLGAPLEYWHSHKCHLTQSVGHIPNRIVPHWAWILSRRCARTFCTKPPRSPLQLCPLQSVGSLGRLAISCQSRSSRKQISGKYAAQLVCLKKFPNSMSFNP